MGYVHSLLYHRSVQWIHKQLLRTQNFIRKYPKITLGTSATLAGACIAYATRWAFKKGYGKYAVFADITLALAIGCGAKKMHSKSKTQKNTPAPVGPAITPHIEEICNLAMNQNPLNKLPKHRPEKETDHHIVPHNNLITPVPTDRTQAPTPAPAPFSTPTPVEQQPLSTHKTDEDGESKTLYICFNNQEYLVPYDNWAICNSEEYKKLNKELERLAQAQPIDPEAFRKAFDEIIDHVDQQTKPLCSHENPLGEQNPQEAVEHINTLIYLILNKYELLESTQEVIEQKLSSYPEWLTYYKNMLSTNTVKQSEITAQPEEEEKKEEIISLTPTTTSADKTATTEPDTHQAATTSISPTAPAPTSTSSSTPTAVTNHTDQPEEPTAATTTTVTTEPTIVIATATTGKTHAETTVTTTPSTSSSAQGSHVEEKQPQSKLEEMTQDSLFASFWEQLQQQDTTQLQAIVTEISRRMTIKENISTQQQDTLHWQNMVQAPAGGSSSTGLALDQQNSHSIPFALYQKIYQLVAAHTEWTQTLNQFFALLQTCTPIHTQACFEPTDEDITLFHRDIQNFYASPFNTTPIDPQKQIKDSAKQSLTAFAQQKSDRIKTEQELKKQKRELLTPVCEAFFTPEFDTKKQAIESNAIVKTELQTLIILQAQYALVNQAKAELLATISKAQEEVIVSENVQENQITINNLKQVRTSIQELQKKLQETVNLLVCTNTFLQPLIQQKLKTETDEAQKIIKKAENYIKEKISPQIVKVSEKVMKQIQEGDL